MLTAQHAWMHTLNELLGNELYTKIKGALGPDATRYEILGHQQISNMKYPMIEVKDRPHILDYARSELVFIMAGSNRLDFSSRINKTLSEWSIDKLFVRGAYGPKFIDQLPYLLETFRYDLNSRRAFINIWRDSPGPSKDTPCLCSLQFLVRNNYLHCIATMRSSDAWLGLPNDTMVFSFLAEYIKNLIEEYLGIPLELGNLYNTAGSRHIYEKDVKKVMEILK